MIRHKNDWTDARVEAIIGTLLRWGVMASATVVAAGAIFYLLKYGGTPPHYRTFTGEPSDLRSVRGIAGEALALRSRGLIQFGLLMLIATPVARVAFSVFAFAMERDRLYVVVTLIVLSLLVFSLSGGHF